MDSLYLVMPAYNEEANIEETVREWAGVLEGKAPESRLVVADSGSTDRTHEILLRLKEVYPQLEILENTGKQHGPKLIALYKYAIEKKADYIFQTDSDGQTFPAEFEKFWRNRKKYDGIFGCRRDRQDGKARLFVENIVCILLRLYFGVKIPDANAPFRLMKTETVEKYIHRMPEDYALPNIMMTVFFVYYGERTVFPAISFRPRSGGVSSINVPKIIKIGVKSLGEFKKYRREMKKSYNRNKKL